MIYEKNYHSIYFTYFLGIKQTQAIRAADKKDLPYEINAITFDANYMYIKGWGYLNDIQHYYNQADHSYELEFVAQDHSFKINGQTTSVSMTDYEYFDGSRQCGNNEYFQSSHICNYLYENVGFNFKVPLSKFKMDSEYKVYLIFYAKTANKREKISLFYPINKEISSHRGLNYYIIDSNLDDISLKINYHSIRARNKPDKKGSVYQAKKLCKNGVRYDIYYKKDAIFKRIYNKTHVNNTTFYQLKGKLSGCDQYANNVLVEGNDIDPLWIASNFVSYQGKPLTIVTKYINNSPSIDGEALLIRKGDKINYYENLYAYDVEDGDLTDKISLIWTNYQDLVGEYQATYQVIDSHENITKFNRPIIVLDINSPPVIIAEDQIIEQYSYFNPLDKVKAYDQELNDISKNVKTTNKIDTAIIKRQKQCYRVTDRNNLTTNKCINVTIVPKGKLASKYLRFIQKNNLFYKENIPSSWLYKYQELKDLLKNTMPYFEISG